MKTIKLRFLYTLHMLAPIAFVEWHIQRLSADTLQALRALCS